MPLSCAPKPTEKKACKCGCGRMFVPNTRGHKYATVNTPSDHSNGFSANAWHYNTYVNDRSPVPGPRKNYLRRNMIPWQRQTADGTEMPALTECLRNAGTADAFLRSAIGILADKLTTGTFSLVVSKLKTLGPTDIVNAFSQQSCGHAFNVQVFNSDQAEPIDPIAAQFVMKVRSLIGNVSMDMLQNANRLASSVATFLSTGNAPLSDAQLCLRLPVIPGIVNRRAIRERCEVGQANVDANRSVTDWQWHCILLKAKTRVPFASLAFDGDSLYLSLDRTMQLDFYVSGARNTELPGRHQAATVTVAIARKGDRVEAKPRFESRKPRLGTALYASKERLERFVESPQHILAAGKISERQATVSTHCLKLVSLIVVADRLLAKLPGPYALLQGGIVKRARFAQLAFQKRGLRLSGIQPIFVRKPHLCEFLFAGQFANSQFNNGRLAKAEVLCQQCDDPQSFWTQAKTGTFLGHSCSVPQHALQHIGVAA